MGKNFIIAFSCFVLLSCSIQKLNKGLYSGSVTTSNYKADTLQSPYATASANNYSQVIGWKNAEMPVAPKGFSVTKFADGLEHPRWIYVAENGDIFVAESNTILKGIKKIGAKLLPKLKTQHYGESLNRITLFRDTDKNGVPEKRYEFAKNLNQPFGMLIIANHFYVGNTDTLMKYNYKTGDTLLQGKWKKLSRCRLVSTIGTGHEILLPIQKKIKYISV